MKIYSTSFVIKEMQVKTTVVYYFDLNSLTKIFQCGIPRIGDVEPRNSYTTAGGRINLFQPFWKIIQHHLSGWNVYSLWLRNSTFWYLAYRNSSTHVLRDRYKDIHSSILVTAKTGNNQNSHQQSNGLKIMIYSYNWICTATKMNKL